MSLEIEPYTFYTGHLPTSMLIKKNMLFANASVSNYFNEEMLPTYKFSYFKSPYALLKHFNFH